MKEKQTPSVVEQHNSHDSEPSVRIDYAEARRERHRERQVYSNSIGLSELTRSLDTSRFQQYDSFFGVDIPNDGAEYYNLAPLFEQNILTANPLSERIVTVKRNNDIYSDMNTADYSRMIEQSEFHVRANQLVQGATHTLQLWAKGELQGDQFSLCSVEGVDEDMLHTLDAALGGQFSFVDGGAGKECVYSLELAPDTPRYAYTDSCRKLTEYLDDNDMRLSDICANELVAEGDARYGGWYAFASRELVKQISDCGNGVFRPQHEGSDSDNADDREVLPTGDVPADMLLLMSRQVLEREDDDRASDIPVYEGRVAMRNGSCKDVEAYYAQATIMNGKLQVERHAGKVFLCKDHGASTLLNSEPVKYNGITIPPGFVWGRQDEYIIPMRATAYCFTEEEMGDAKYALANMSTKEYEEYKESMSAVRRIMMEIMRG